MLLSINELKNSSDELKLLSLEYAIVFACKEMSKTEDKYKFENFNDKNNLQRIHIVSYPFYIASSNGHSESLFNLFGDFIPTKLLGITSQKFIDIIIKNEKKGFFINFGTNKAEIIDKNKYNNWESLLSDILDYQVDSVKFKDYEINKDNDSKNYLYKGIESGIKTLLYYSNSMFFKMDKFGLITASNMFKCYRDALKEKTNIEYNILKQEKRNAPYYSLKFS